MNEQSAITAEKNDFVGWSSDIAIATQVEVHRMLSITMNTVVVRS